MKLTYKDLTKENWFLVSWTLSNKCNYRCAYCPSYSNDGSSGWPNKNHVFNFVKTFNLLGKQICYRLTGGEPTYWKYFIELAQIVHNEGHYFSFLTNGSRSVEYYKEISQWTDGALGRASLLPSENSIHLFPLHHKPSSYSTHPHQLKRLPFLPFSCFPYSAHLKMLRIDVGFGFSFFILLSVLQGSRIRLDWPPHL